MAGLTLPPGRFEVGEQIGIGGESLVVEARDTSRDEVVAVKVPADRSPAGLEAFHRSSTMHGLVRHPNVVAVLEHSADSKAPFLVMERLEGQTLSARLRTGDPPDVTEAVNILAGVAAGLEATHAAGLVHRDVKPGNIMLLDDGGVKIMDYGVAAYQDFQRRDLRARGGTPGYMAPERIPREPGVPVRRGGPAADLYALGAVGYELFSGLKPFGVGTHQEITRLQLSGDFMPLTAITEEVPRPLAEMVDSMLSLHPNRRPRSAALVRARLNALASGEPQPTDLAAGLEMSGTNAASAGFRPVSPTSEVWRPPRPKSREAARPAISPRPEAGREAERPRSRGNDRDTDGPGDGLALG